MKAFLIALAVVCAVGLGSGVLLTTLNPTAGEAHSTDSVRLH